MHSALDRRLWLLRALVAAVLLGAFILPAQAQSAAEQARTRGLTWLVAQVGADGALTSEAAAVAAPLQVRSEAMLTLVQAGRSVPAALTQGLSADTTAEAELLARKLLALRAAGAATGPLETALLALQRSDGGVAAQSDAGAGVLDTAWALRAWASDAARADIAAAWLRQRQLASGAWEAAPRSPLLSTATALRALREIAARNAEAATAASQAASYLLAQRSGSALWDSSVWLNALVFEAVHDYVAADAPLRGLVRDALIAAQATDGSWGGDPYATALALRALSLSEQAPANPVFGIVRGRAIDAATGQPIQGVSIVLSPGALTTTTATDGSFELRDLDAGVYAFEMSLADYSTVRSSIAVVAGRTLDLGALAMSRSAGATTATVRGIIADAPTGLPIGGATIVVTDAGQTTSLADGSYQVSNVAAGTRSITVSRSGYQSATASATFAAGDMFVFSPLLVPDNTTPPAGSGVMEGRVIDAGTGAALAGATVTVMIPNLPDVVQASAADGSFRIEGLPTSFANGLAVVSVRLVNYGDAYHTVYGSPGNLGTLRLMRAAELQLLPDLVVSALDRTAAVTDPQRLTVSGHVRARVSNLGTVPSPAGVVLTAFEDSNRNGAFDAESDLVLGTATLAQAIEPSSTASIDVPLAGTVRFRDNQIHVLVDSALTLVEIDESNNVAFCECSVGLPFVEDFNDGVADGVQEIPNLSMTTWTAANGYYEGLSQGGAIFGSRHWRDYDAEVKVLFPSGPSNDASLVFRYMEATPGDINTRTGYRLMIKANHVRIYHFNIGGGSGQVVAEAPLPVEENRWYRLKVAVRGSSVRAYVDGVQVLTYSGLLNPVGAVGVMQDAVPVRYDDLRVFDVPLLEEDFSDPATNPFLPASFGDSQLLAGNVVNGEFVGSGYAAWWAGDRSWTNYSAEAEVRFISGLHNDAGLVVLAGNAPQNAPHLQVSLNGTLLRLGTVLPNGSGAVVRARTVPVSSDPSHRYKMRFEIIDQTAKFYFENEYMFEYANLGWSNGAVGMFQQSVTAAYDNYVVRGLRGAADLTASYVRVTDAGTSGTSRVTVRVGNGGTRPALAGTYVTLYRGSPSAANRVQTVQTTMALSQGEYQDLDFNIAGGLGSLGQVTIVVDDDGSGTSQVVECDETNNSISAELGTLAVNLSVVAAASQASYNELDTAQFTASVSNSGSLAQAGQVRFSVETLEGQPVQVLPLPAAVNVAAAGQVPVVAAWPVAGTLSGDYRVRAELLNAQGVVYASALAPFAVEASNTAHVGARISADRAQYSAAQTIQLRSRVHNATVNMLVEGLVPSTRILDSAGQVAWTRSESTLQLAAGNHREYPYSVPASGLTPGAYSAVLEVRDALGNLRASSSVLFSVLGTDHSGVGLRGSLEVPATLALGETASIGYSVINGGNAALSAVPLTLRLVDPAAGVLRGEFALTATLAAGASQAGAVNWQAVGSAGQDVVAVLAAAIGGTEHVLAQAPMRLTGATSAIDLGVSTGVVPDARVLALVSCRSGKEDVPECLARRVAAVSAALAAQGVPYRVVSTAAEFEAELRCGTYNVYWVSGGGFKLSDTGAKEVREAVRRGDGLIIDGEQNVYDAQDEYLHSAAGVHLYNIWIEQNRTIDILPGSLFDAGALATLGWARSYILTTGQTVARFDATWPAIVQNQYGAGKGVVLAFDFAEMLATPGSQASQLQALLADALQTVAVAPTWLTVGDAVRSAVEVHNRGAQTVDVEARVQLPLGSTYVDAHPAPTQLIAATASTGAQAIWRFDLAAGASSGLKLRHRLDVTGLTDVSVPVTVYSRNGSAEPVLQGSASHSLPVHDGLALTNAGLAAIQALSPTSEWEQQVRGYMLNAANAAVSHYASDPAMAIWKWTMVAGMLPMITTDDVAKVAAAQTAVAMAIEAATDKLCRP